MSKREISPEEFRALLPQICDRETAYDKVGWSPQNPLWSHCLTVSLLAKQHFGGDLLAASLKDVPAFSHMGRHIVNRLPNGMIEDFTAAQFGDNYPQNFRFKTISSPGILFHPKTGQPRKIMKRYRLIAWRLAKALYPGNPIFDDSITQECFYAALDSPCQKMKFGCLVVREGQIVARTFNKTYEPLRHLCEPTCIRFGIQSRTESMLGACGHAEEWALDAIREQGIPTQECDFYIFGLEANGLPWFRKERAHTCLRCATQMWRAGIRNIYVALEDRWERLSAEEAVATASEFALQQKKV